MNAKDKKTLQDIMEQHQKVVAKMPMGTPKGTMQIMFEFLISALLKEAQLNEKAEPLIAKSAELLDVLVSAVKVIPPVLEREGADPDGKLEEFLRSTVTLLKSDEMKEERKILQAANRGLKKYLGKKRKPRVNERGDAVPRGWKKIGVIR